MYVSIFECLYVSLFNYVYVSFPKYLYESFFSARQNIFHFIRFRIIFQTIYLEKKNFKIQSESSINQPSLQLIWYPIFSQEI